MNNQPARIRTVAELAAIGPYPQAIGEPNAQYAARMDRVVKMYDAAFIRQGKTTEGQLRNQQWAAERRDRALARTA